MDWVVHLAERLMEGMGSLIGRGLSAAGEKLVDKALPATRPLDAASTARRIHGESDELSLLSGRLRTYKEEANKRCEELCRRVVDAVALQLPDLKESPLRDRARLLCWKLLEYEGYFPVSDMTGGSKNLSLGEIWTRKKTLRHQLAFFETPTTLEKIETILKEFVLAVLCGVSGAVRQDENAATFSVPLFSLHSEVAYSITALGGVMGRECEESDGEPFPRLWKRYADNLAIASGINPEEMEHTNREPLFPVQAINKSALELIDSYLAETPFIEFYKLPVAFTIPLASRFSHMHIVAGSGHGKTKTAQSLILSDLSEVRDGKRTVIVIDSQGDMIQTILNLPLVG